ncbi:UNVERIFIED_CONTAM: Eukaryotic translation initiation factor 1A [Sesamum indicum]
MLKNKGKGGKNRKRRKNEADGEKRELVFKEDGQEYAQVLRMLGNGRCEAMGIDGVKRLWHIRGKMHTRRSGLLPVILSSSASAIIKMTRLM